MAESFHVQVQPDADVIRLRSHGRHPIVCPIAVRLRDTWFPAEAWDDFALTILEMWLQTIRDLEHGAVRTAQLPFMDGPWTVRVSPTTAGLWLVELLHRGQKTVTQGSGICERDQIKSEIVEALRQVLAGVKQAGLWTESCQRLEASVV